ncbi:hypothetical protein LXL04_003295 [Taraxacum kok-saghyz]
MESFEPNSLHGIPKSIISARDSLELFKQLGTRLRYSTAYHPQSDGQTEVVNRCFQNFLRSFASEEPQSWSKFLYLAEYWYNTSHHSAINMAPFQALYGRPIPDLNHYTPVILAWLPLMRLSPNTNAYEPSLKRICSGHNNA